MKYSSNLLLFLVLLVGLLLPAYFIQEYYGSTDENLSLKFTYTFNILFTLPFTTIIILLNKLLKRYIGFIFMGLGFIKITAFLIFTKVNNIDINRSNFLVFFVPYAICLTVEIIVLSRYLNRAKF